MSETLVGTVERVTYYNPENGYTVAQITPEGRAYTVTAVGNLLGVSAGENLRLYGQWTRHPRFGRQFQVERYTTVLPATTAGIEKYLGSGMIKGIGPVLARRIVRRFKMYSLQIIEDEPQRLQEVLGIGRKRVALIQQAWEEQKAIKEVMLFLQSHNVSTSHAVRIFKTYGDASVDVVRRDPYRLARDIHGIGFITADRIAREIGLAADSPQRVQAGVTYTLGQMADDGHVYGPEETLIRESTRLLEVPREAVMQALQSLADEGEIHLEPMAPEADLEPVYRPPQDHAPPPPAGLREQQAVYLRPFYFGEVGAAQGLLKILREPRSRLAYHQTADLDRVFDHLSDQDGLILNQGQRQAVRTALTHKVMVLTGGPGTGKTTAIQTIIRLLETQKHSYALAAPTGRAAKRLAEATMREAKTIHRLLEFKPRAGMPFQRNEENPIEADMVIVDEASMLDLLLSHHLLKAIPPTSHLILVGDVDQLPSVGAGDVLRDVIDSGAAPVVSLTEIFRQAAGSLIIQNAHRINRGELPRFAKAAATPAAGADFYLFPADDAEQAADLVVDLVQNRIPRRFEYDPLEDIQVLSPMHRGAAGVAELNRRLQVALNPPSPRRPERRLGPAVFRLGDRVMQVRNNYDKEVFNGDMGRIVAMDLVNQELAICLDGQNKTYDFAELDELTHAYAVSVHKSQGSEYRAVVVPMLTQHYVMLQRNLFYTAITRARELVVVVGSRQAIAMAVRNTKTTERYTALDARLGAQARAELTVHR